MCYTWIGWVTQFAKNDPVVTLIESNFPQPLTFQRGDKGLYVIISPVPVFVEFKTRVLVAFEQLVGNDCLPLAAFDYQAQTNLGLEVHRVREASDNWNAVIQIDVFV